MQLPKLVDLNGDGEVNEEDEAIQSSEEVNALLQRAIESKEHLQYELETIRQGIIAKSFELVAARGARGHRQDEAEAEKERMNALIARANESAQTASKERAAAEATLREQMEEALRASKEMSAYVRPDGKWPPNTAVFGGAALYRRFDEARDAMERTMSDASHLLEARVASAAPSSSAAIDVTDLQPPSPLGSPGRGDESKREKLQRRAAAGIAWRQSAFLVSGADRRRCWCVQTDLSAWLVSAAQADKKEDAFLTEERAAEEEACVIAGGEASEADCSRVEEEGIDAARAGAGLQGKAS